MSSRSMSEPGASGILRAIGKFRGAERTLGDRAREAQRAADPHAKSACHAAPAQSEEAPISTPQEACEVWPLPGLAPMTRVRTSFGDVHAAALRKGDEVLTRSGEYRRIEWLNRIHLDAHVLAMKPDTNPVVLSPGALGGRLPTAEIMVSPRQVIAADENNGLSRDREASMLLSRQGVRRLHETSLSYTMFHVGEAAEVLCEGLFLSFPMDA